MKALRLLPTILFACAACTAAAEPFAQRMDSLLSARYTPRAHEPGAAVMIIKGDSTLFENYYGYGRLDKPREIDADTRFCIASVSKQFTVVALLQQVALGRVGLSQAVSDWEPYPQPFWQQVSLGQLASHSSGVPDSRDRSDRRATIYANDSTSMLYFPYVDSLKFEPGTAYDYLNPSFLILADVVSRCSGQPFVEYAADSVFRPAGMTHACYFDPALEDSYESHGYMPDSLGRWQEFDYGEETFYATRPDGGIYATARDLAAWERALWQGKVLDRRLLGQAYMPWVNVSDSPWCDYQRRPDTWYGLGWFVDTTPGMPVKVYHTGDNGGYQAYLAKYPAEQVAIIVLENRHDFDRWQLALEIDRLLLEENIIARP